MIIDKIVTGIFDALNQLLPKPDRPLIEWIAKISTLSLVAASFSIGSFAVLRDTDFGKQYGISTPDTISLTSKYHRDIQMMIWSILSRMKEEKPDIRGAYFMAAFDEEGHITYANQDYNNYGIFTWFIPSSQYISFQTFENVIDISRAQFVESILIKKTCTSGIISETNRARYRQAISNFQSDRFAICPVPKYITGKNSKGQNLQPYGAVIVFWVNDPKDGRTAKDVESIVDSAAQNIGEYLQTRTKLKINEK
jgi:hypothetical protein